MNLKTKLQEMGKRSASSQPNPTSNTNSSRQWGWRCSLLIPGVGPRQNYALLWLTHVGKTVSNKNVAMHSTKGL